jgi:hypothetical protein
VKNSASFWGRRKKRRNGSNDSDNDEGGNGSDAEQRYPNSMENSTRRSHIAVKDDIQYRLISLDVSGMNSNVRMGHFRFYSF